MSRLIQFFFFLITCSLLADKPNIIFLLADDQRASALSCAGDPLIQTPHLDALAKGGQRFTNAYSVAPICKPSRVSFMLGQYQRTHGVGFSSKKKMNEEQWSNSYPKKLRDAGYHTGFIGKFGVDNYSFKGKGAEKFDYWMAHDGWAPFFPKEQENTAIYKQFKSNIITEIMGEAMEEFLETAPTDKPFCLSVSFSAPHASTATTMMEKSKGGWSMTKAANTNTLIKDHPIYGSLFRDQDISFPDTMDGKPEKYLPLNVVDAENGRKKCYVYDYKKESLREHKYRYAQLIHGVDHQIGKLVSSLKARGLDKNTIIIYSSDNGLLMGDYNQGGKGLLYDLAAKVPFVVFDPRLQKDKRGQVNESLILSIDLAPTLLSYAGVEAPETMQGTPLQGVINDPASGRKDAKGHNPINTIIKLTTSSNPLKLQVIEPTQLSQSLSRQATSKITASTNQEGAGALIKSGKEFVSGAHHRKAWTGRASDKKPSLEIDFGAAKTFSKIALEERMAWTDMCRGFHLEYLDSKGQWKEIATGKYLGDFTLQHEPITAQKVRIRLINHERSTSILSFDIFE